LRTPRTGAFEGGILKSAKGEHIVEREPPMGRSLQCGSGAKMPMFRVQIWPEGEGPKSYETVEAETEKDAAERIYGRPLREEGMLHQLRAVVRPLDDPRKTVSLYALPEPRR
jgi:hypothetical protein